MLRLPKYKITSVDDSTIVVTITAKTKEQAWAKFITQRFGALKPSRSEWTIEQIES